MKSKLSLILSASLSMAAMGTHAQTIDFNLAKGSLTIPVLRAGTTSLYDVVLQFGADGRFTPTSYSATPSSVLTPATAATAGTLTFSSFLGNDAANFGWSIAQNVAITGAGATSEMTFTNPAFTLTGAAGGVSTFSANEGQVKADGNVVSYCSAGNQTTYGATEAINKPFQNGHRVFISANLTPVTSLAEINGLSFSLFNCTGSNAKVSIDTVGGAVFTSPTGNNTISAALSAQLFAEAGLQAANGAGTKLRLYKYSASGAPKYFILSIDKYSGGGETSVGYVSLLSQD